MSPQVLIGLESPSRASLDGVELNSNWKARQQDRCRRRLGDERFTRMLGELRKRFEWKALDTDSFRRLCAEFLPPGAPDNKLETFFDQWVYGTGVPTLKLTSAVNGKAGKYVLTARVVTVQDGQKFALAVNEPRAPVEVAVPYTIGQWQLTQPVEISLVKGKNVLEIGLKEGSRGVTIKEFTLKPVK